MATTNKELAVLAQEYPPAKKEEVLALAAHYRRRSERQVLELAALASDLTPEHLIGLGLEPQIDPQLLEAFEGQYPNVELDSLAGRSSGEIEGFVNGVKGKYFEVLVRDRLNSGETIGELQLEPGQIAQLADSPTQAGWDLEIVDRNGNTVEQIQLKATESMSYVKEALERYPDIRVAVPEDIKSASDAIIGTDISQGLLEQTTEEQLAELSEGSIANALDIAAELAIDVVPLTSALVIGVTEGRRYFMGRATLQESMDAGAGRLGRATAYSTMGASLSATGLGLAAIPVVMGARVAESRVTGMVDLADSLAARTFEIKSL